MAQVGERAAHLDWEDSPLIQSCHWLEVIDEDRQGSVFWSLGRSGHMSCCEVSSSAAATKTYLHLEIVRPVMDSVALNEAQLAVAALSRDSKYRTFVSSKDDKVVVLSSRS